MATGKFKQNEARLVNQLQGKYYESNILGDMYTFGLSNTALVAENAIATGLTETAKPVIGIWNDTGTGVNLVVTKAYLIQTTVANTAVSPGGFMWMYSRANADITTGSTPLNLSTYAASGSNAKAFAVSTALTGLTNNVAVLRAAPFTPINAAGPSTAIHQPQGVSVDFIDGGIIVPEGGVLALMNQLSTTTVSVSVGIDWIEVVL